MNDLEDQIVLDLTDLIFDEKYYELKKKSSLDEITNLNKPKVKKISSSDKIKVYKKAKEIEELSKQVKDYKKNKNENNKKSDNDKTREKLKSTRETEYENIFKNLNYHNAYENILDEEIKKKPKEENTINQKDKIENEFIIPSVPINKIKSTTINQLSDNNSVIASEHSQFRNSSKYLSHIEVNSHANNKSNYYDTYKNNNIKEKHLSNYKLGSTDKHSKHKEHRNHHKETNGNHHREKEKSSSRNNISPRSKSSQSEYINKSDSKQERDYNKHESKIDKREKKSLHFSKNTKFVDTWTTNIKSSSQPASIKPFSLALSTCKIIDANFLQDLEMFKKKMSYIFNYNTSPHNLDKLKIIKLEDFDKRNSINPFLQFYKSSYEDPQLSRHLFIDHSQRLNFIKKFPDAKKLITKDTLFNIINNKVDKVYCKIQTEIDFYNKENIDPIKKTLYYVKLLKNSENIDNYTKTFVTENTLKNKLNIWDSEHITEYLLNENNLDEY